MNKYVIWSSEIQPSHMRLLKVSTRNHRNALKKRRRFYPLNGKKSNVTAGRIITHNKFGKGVITKKDGAYVTIRFDEVAGEKKFDLTMAVQNGLIEI